MKQQIFYSWQSDLPNRTNRGFISDCLERAVKALQKDDSVDIHPVIDRDTEGVSGTPEIAQTIFAKIDDASIFVADISIINACSEGSRLTPNPNVLVELGYAASSLGWQNVLCVFNAAVSDLKDLPFDLKSRRVIDYSLGPDENKEGARKVLVGKLKRQIEYVLISQHIGEEQTEFLRRAQELLGVVVIYCREFGSRKIGDHLRQLRREFGWVSKEIEKLIAIPPGDGEYPTKQFDRLAEILARIDEYRLASGREVWAEFNGLFVEANLIARELYFNTVLPQIVPSTSKVKCREVLGKHLARVERLQPKIEQKIMRGNTADLFEVTSEIGLEILWLALKQVNGINNVDLEALTEIGHKFHVVETISTSNAMRALPQVLTAVNDATNELRGFLKNLK